MRSLSSGALILYLVGHEAFENNVNERHIIPKIKEKMKIRLLQYETKFKQ